MQNMNPWKYLAAYEEQDKDIFYGREKEQDEFTALVKNNLYVTLYGRTGIGKTSFLKAGVFPQLRESNYFPIVVRFSSMDYDKESFAELIVSLIKNQEGIEVENPTGHEPSPVIKEDKKDQKEVEVENPTEHEPSPVIKKDNLNYLWEYFATRHFYNKEGDEVFPVIVLDQFEENLISQRGESELLLKQIYALVDDNKDFPAGYHSETNFRFIISIREDELFRLEESIDKCQLFDFKKNRYRLSYLSRQSAEEVITKPCNEQLLPKDEQKRKDIIDGIIKLSTDKDSDGINTILLSLILSCMYERCAARKEKVFTVNDINSFGKDLLVDFYQSLPVKKKTRKVIEDKFIDAQGRRNMVNIGNLDIPQQELDKLCNGSERILQKSDKRIELVHDLLALAIFEAKQQRRKEESSRMYKILLITFFSFVFILGLMRSVISNTNVSDIKTITEEYTSPVFKDNEVEEIVIDNNRVKFSIVNCKSLKRVTVKRDIKYFKIENCPSLQNIELSDSVNLDIITLHDCPQLRNLYIPNNINKIYSDTKLNVLPNPDNRRYEVKDGNVWDLETKRIVYNAEVFRVERLFSDSILVIFPNMLCDEAKVIDTIRYVFDEKQITVYNTARITEEGFIVVDKYRPEVIGYTAVYKNIDLSNLRVGDGAFANCKELESVRIDSDTHFGEYVFTNCPNLKRIIIYQDYTLNHVGYIQNLLDAVRTVQHPLIYEIEGEGPLKKNNDGVVFLDTIPVLVSAESKKEYEIMAGRNDTTYLCTKGWFVIRTGNYQNVNGKPFIKYLPDNILNKYVIKGVYLEDSFVEGDVNNDLVYCGELTKKEHTFYIRDNNVKFLDLPDSVKRKITVFVPYGQLERFVNDERFIDFKDVREMSLLRSMAANASNSFEGAWTVVSNNKVFLLLFVVAIASLLLLFWYTSFIKLKRQNNARHIIIRSITSSLSTTAFVFFVWVSTYWFVWFFFFSGVSGGNIISTVIGISVVLLAMLLMHKNVLYRVKGIKQNKIDKNEKG